jgi:hypothetical protein
MKKEEKENKKTTKKDWSAALFFAHWVVLLWEVYSMISTQESMSNRVSERWQYHVHRSVQG